MKFFTVVFDYNGSDKYTRMIDALKRSIEANTDAELIIERVKNPVQRYGSKGSKQLGLVANSIKLDVWEQYSKTMTENTVFIDGDCVVLKSVDYVFEENFDLAFTYRSKGLPMNAGVVFAKPTQPTKDFIHSWRFFNEQLATDWREHNAYMARFGGMNQAAYGKVIINELHRANLLQIPCFEFNCCDLWDWVQINDETRILHAKSELREMIFGEKNHSQLQKAKSIYSTYLI